MPRIRLSIVLVPLLAVSAAALAQSRNSGTDTTGTPPPAASQRAMEASPGAQPDPHADVDARACLEFVSNIGVIKCAEKYRSHRAERRNRS